MRHIERFSLLTFYKFVNIPEVEVPRLVKEQWQFCHDIGLKGRVYLGVEGISSTVTGNEGQLWAYRQYLESISYFQNIEDIDTKATPVDGHQFAKMVVKERKEIVTLGEQVNAEDVKKFKKEVSIDEFKKIVDSGNTDDYMILDMRNDYEYRLGHFKNAVPAGTTNFREVPKLIEKYKEQAQGKKIIWYCTGGIRCEKAAVIMNKHGFEDVYSIEGGVVKYTNTFNDGNWLGNLYTFDGRVSTQIGDKDTHTTIGTCLFSGKPTDNCENCRHAPCNARLIADASEYKKHGGFCSHECREGAKIDGLVKNVPWDTFNYNAAQSTIRNIPEKRGEVVAQIASHIEKQYGKVVYSCEFSQKEGVICEC
jgi:UPF0176 protein